MPHPHKRSWTLATLDRDGAGYRLWFDHDAFRWEVGALPESRRPGAGDGACDEPTPAAGAADTPTGPLVTPSGPAGRRWYARRA